MAVRKVRKAGTQVAVREDKEDIMAVKKTKKNATVDIQKLVSEAAFPETEIETAPTIKKNTAKVMKMKPVSEVNSAPKGAYVVIDHPMEGELVSGLAYVMRIGAAAGGRVEVSINNGDWSPARHSAGYWWFDWGYYKPGPHTVVARLIDDKGKVLKKSATRKCTVV
jgi:hypothetical protein